MKVYIDFDDVICETAKFFMKIAKELFQVDVPYRQVQFFNLQKTFDVLPPHARDFSRELGGFLLEF